MNRRNARRVGVAWLIATGVLFAIGCGSSQRASVLAPSSISPSSNATDRLSAQTVGAASTTSASGITVTALVSGTSCPTLQFNVYTYVFKTSTATTYSGGSCANIQAGTVFSFSGTRPSNSELVFYVDTITLLSGQATTPKPEPTPDTPPAGQTDVTISSLVTGTSCPELQFRSGTYVFKTTTSTKYDGGGCTGLKAGLTIALGGTKQTDTLVLVSAVTFKKDGTSTTPSPTTPAPPAEDTEPVDADVVVSGLVSGSACPYLQFTVGDYRFVTARTTRFDGGQCENVAAGSSLHVTGAKRKSDGTVLVSAILIKQTDSSSPSPTVPTDPTTPQDPTTPRDPTTPKDPPPADPTPQTIVSTFTVSGLVAGTKCPALGIVVSGYTVKMDEHTEYFDGACTDVKPRTKLYVHGVVVGEKTVLATLVAFLD